MQHTKPKRSIYFWILEIATLLSLIWCFYPLLHYNTLINTTIPIHYDINGEVNAWGSRSFLWFLPLLSLAMYIGISVLEKYYPKLNYPVKVTPENAVPLYRLTLSLLRHVKFFVILLFAYINNASLTNEAGLNKLILWILVADIFIQLFIHIIKMLRLEDKTNRTTK